MANVYIPEKERKQARFQAKLKFYLGILLVGLFVISSVYVIFVSDLFKVKEVSITGNFEDTDAIRAAFSASISGNLDNYIFWPKEMPAEFFALMPAVFEAEIKKDFFNKKITINVKEREKFGIWCFKKKCFWFDGNGVVFETAPSAQSALVLTINSSYPVGLGKKVFEENRYLQNVSAAFLMLKEIGISIKELRLSDPELKEFHVNTYEETEMYFSLDVDSRQFAAGIKKLAANPGLKKLRYLDMRVENRIYYK